MIDTLRTPELEAFLDGLPGDRQQNMLRYEAILDRGGPDSALVHMVEASLRAPDDGAMPESEKAAAFARLFTTIHAATHESLDQVQAHTDRLWGRLSNDEKRQIALNPSAAATIAIDAMRNDPLLAARVTPTASDTPRGIEAYQGGAALGFMGGHFAALRGQDAARAAEARQFADLGISRADAATFSSIGLDRVMFDRYLREGFTQAQIVSGARDANALGFRGREDIDIAMNAPPELRAAALAIQRAETPEAKEAARRRYEEVRERLQQQYPPGHPQRQHIENFDQRFQQVNGVFLDHVHRNGPEAILAMSHEERVEANRRAIGGHDFNRIQTAIAVRNDRALSTQPDEQRIEAAFADFELDPAATPHTAMLPSNTPDATAAATASPADDTATHTADAAPVESGTVRTADTTLANPTAAAVTVAENTAGTKPAADNRTRVARATARLPSATA